MHDLGLKLKRRHALRQGAQRLESVQFVLRALQNKDETTYRHVVKVAEYAAALAQYQNLDPALVEHIYCGALVHDIGKLFWPSSQLSAPDVFVTAQRRELEDHTVLGYELALTLPELHPYLDIIRYHHERFDGLGYPNGLRGEQIPLSARIVAVADALEVMTTGRNYQNAQSTQYAITELLSKTGGQFCPTCARFAARALHHRIPYIPVSPRASNKRALVSMPR